MKTETSKGDYLLRAYEQNHFNQQEEMINFIESEFGDGIVLELHKRFLGKYGLPKLGTGRATYLSKSCVFKLPVSPDGFRQNDREGCLCEIGEAGKQGHIPIARSKLIIIKDIPIVIMEKVEIAFFDDIKAKMGHVPEFVTWVDMGQVGFDRKNKLVAFDYADL